MDLGMCTTAEGVESQADLDFLRENDCTEIQGYLISAAIPSHAVPELLTKFARGQPTRTSDSGLLQKRLA
jgi:EAL domain-containing protein (putative c-di-GMP-specific phosphodiesterase class I)